MMVEIMITGFVVAGIGFVKMWNKFFDSYTDIENTAW